MGADCLGTTPPPGTARADCEAVCAAEDQCHQADATVARGKAECLTALCTDTGFKVVDTGANASDLASLTSNDCEKAATDCAALLLCSCPDSCARVTQCTGDANATCTDDCDNLIPSDPALYVENRCKMEATCADLAACGSAE